MGGTANEVSEFAEKLISTYYNAQQLPVSNMSADLLTKDGKYIQVKSGKIEQLTTTSLNVIRSWNFDILVAVIFSKHGDILTTSKKLFDHKNSVDITIALQKIMNHNNEKITCNQFIKKKK